MYGRNKYNSFVNRAVRSVWRATQRTNVIVRTRSVIATITILSFHLLLRRPSRCVLSLLCFPVFSFFPFLSLSLLFVLFPFVSFSFFLSPFFSSCFFVSFVDMQTSNEQTRHRAFCSIRLIEIVRLFVPNGRLRFVLFSDQFRIDRISWKSEYFLVVFYRNHEFGYDFELPGIAYEIVDFLFPFRDEIANVRSSFCFLIHCQR